MNSKTVSGRIGGCGAVGELRRDVVFAEQLLDKQLTFHTTWGLFSPRGIDDGTRLLLNYLEIGPELKFPRF